MVVTVTGQVLALVGVVIVAALIRRASRLETSLSCVLAGFLAGLLVSRTGFDTGIRFHNLQDIVFFLILPVLIFEASWHIKPALLKRWLLPALLLATIGVVVSCLVTAVLAYLGMGHPEGFPWIAALLTGAILAATDPVSVIDRLKAERASEDLKTLVEGESLFNDATAIVLFSLVLGIALEPTQSLGGHFFSHFTLVFLGGIVTGIVAGLVSTIVALFLGRPATTTFVLLFTAFGTFYLAEHILKVSGIMAVMFAALVTRYALAEVEDTVANGLGSTWDWLGEVLNCILFVIMGLVITLDMFQSHWLAMLIAIIAALAGRAGAVATCGLLTRPLFHRLTWESQALLFWGGLRGAIALALVLSLPLELPWWYTVQSMVFGVVLFGLLVQGTTVGRLIRKHNKA